MIGLSIFIYGLNESGKKLIYTTRIFNILIKNFLKSLN